MSNKQRSLSRELLQAGARDSETNRLVEVADQLRNLKKPGPVYSRANPGRRLAAFGVTAVFGILIGAGLVAYAQTSLPGSWLYSSKRLSEKVAVAFDPNYRATLMMRRSQEVKDLVGQKANQHVVLATLADYKTEATAYKSSNYAAFEYCKNNLEQAATVAPDPERTAIDGTLSSLQT
jgi:hypothetical protein